MYAYKYYLYGTESVHSMQQVHKEIEHYEARTVARKFFVVKKFPWVDESTKIY